MDPIRVALVEDDTESIYQFRTVLGRIGTPSICSVYQNGLSAIAEIANDDKPDVIVIDWFLPVAVTDWFLPIVDATQFIAELKSLEEFERIPIAVFLRDWRSELEPSELGVCFCLKKPIDVDQMRNLLSAISD